MVREKQEKYLNALRQARQEFSRRSLPKILEVSGARSNNDSELVISYCGELFRVTYPVGEVTRMQLNEHSCAEIQITDQILILQYLTEASGVTASGKWISFLELPGGPHHYSPFKLEAVDPVVKRFGSKPQEFEAACRGVGGTGISLADKAFSIPVFPRIALAVTLWFADEEFPARGNILFDATACMHLNTAGLYVLGINTAERIIYLSEQGGQK